MKNQKIIAVANQKGGVGKTTTTLNVASGLKEKGYKVLLIDFDPQGNLSSYLGFSPDGKPTIGDFMLFEVEEAQHNIKSGIRTNAEGLDYIPATINLSSADVFLMNAISRETVLRRIIRTNDLADYDYILIDCLPSLGTLLTNALVCADGVIIPVQTQTFALEGLQSFFDVFKKVKRYLNTDIEIIGILSSMVENTIISNNAKEMLAENFPELLFKTEINHYTEVQQSALLQKSLLNMQKSKLGNKYRELVNEIIERGGSDV